MNLPACMSLNLPARLSKTKKIHSMDRFHGNGPYGKIPTKKEPIRTLGFTSGLSCHIIKCAKSYVLILEAS